MRMRKKPNLLPRMERTAVTIESAPETRRGSWLADFPGHRELRLELGCGKGRFTVETATAEPDILLVAVEKVPDAMVVGMERVFARGLTNVRFIDGDAAALTELFAPGEVSRIYINFPDPWRKSRQYKRRLTAQSFLALYAGVLAPGGDICFKTDNVPLFEWSLEQLAAGGWQLCDLTRDRHANGPVGVMTDYESKFFEQGVPINYVRAVRP